MPTKRELLAQKPLVEAERRDQVEEVGMREAKFVQKCTKY